MFLIFSLPLFFLCLSSVCEFVSVCSVGVVMILILSSLTGTIYTPAIHLLIKPAAQELWSFLHPVPGCCCVSLCDSSTSWPPLIVHSSYLFLPHFDFWPPMITPCLPACQITYPWLQLCTTDSQVFRSTQPHNFPLPSLLDLPSPSSSHSALFNKPTSIHHILSSVLYLGSFVFTQVTLSYDFNILFVNHILYNIT